MKTEKYKISEFATVMDSISRNEVSEELKNYPDKDILIVWSVTKKSRLPSNIEGFLLQYPKVKEKYFDILKQFKYEKEGKTE